MNFLLVLNKIRNQFFLFYWLTSCDYRMSSHFCSNIFFLFSSKYSANGFHCCSNLILYVVICLSTVIFLNYVLGWTMGWLIHSVLCSFWKYEMYLLLENWHDNIMSSGFCSYNN